MSGVGRQRVWGVGLSAMTGDTHDVMCSARDRDAVRRCDFRTVGGQTHEF